MKLIKSIGINVGFALCAGCVALVPTHERIHDSAEFENQVVAATPLVRIDCPSTHAMNAPSLTCYQAIFGETNAGHYHFRLQLTEPLSTESLSLDAKVESTTSDGGRAPIRTDYAERKEVSYALSALSFNGFKPTRQLGLYPPPYPLDGGWLIGDIRAIHLTLQSSIPLPEGKVLIIRSKWNTPLQERLATVEPSPLPDEPWAPIAVNLQGLSRDQLREVKEARGNWKPMGKLFIIAQLDPRDLSANSLSSDALQVLEELVAWRKENPNIAFGCSVNPYLNAHYRSDSVRFFDGSATAAIRTIIEPYIASHADLILLRTDDFTPTDGSGPFDYGLSAPRDLNVYGDLGTAHATWANDVASYISFRTPHTRIALVPPWYATRFIQASPDRALRYYNTLKTHLSESIPIVWTGPSVRSLEVNDYAVRDIKARVPRHAVILWDNTPYARAHKDFWLNKGHRAHLCSMIEPYDIPISTILLTQDISLPRVLVNTGIAPLQRIQLETTQLYLTNPQAYSAEAALLAVLIRQFGGRIAELLIDFDNVLWREHAASLRANRPFESSVISHLEEVVRKIRANGSGRRRGLASQLSFIIQTLTQ